MRIAEIFESIQGEGRYTGEPSLFVRTTGCNLRCWYCDTPDTSWRPAGDQRPWRDVLDQVLANPCQHVVLTGGEPLLQPDIIPLTAALRDARRFVTIETAGTVFRPLTVDLMSISPKRANSAPGAEHPRWRSRHERERHQPTAIRALLTTGPFQFKFVIDTPADLDDVTAYLAEFPEVSPEMVWLMPQGVDAAILTEKAAWLIPAATERGYRYSPRRHIELFGHQRGT